MDYAVQRMRDSGGPIHAKDKVAIDVKNLGTGCKTRMCAS